MIAADGSIFLSVHIPAITAIGFCNITQLSGRKGVLSSLVRQVDVPNQSSQCNHIIL
jgi:hypothetical protein